MDLASLHKLHDPLPRGAPGSDATTTRAINALPSLPPSARILDVGCGKGKQTLVLARAYRQPVVAIDTHQPYLDHLTQTAAAAGLGHLIETRNLSMDALDYHPESADLIWSEGSVYILGVPAALKLWRPMLKPGALIAFSELTWLIPDPPAEALAFWRTGYPGMETLAGNLARIESEGYDTLETFTVPNDDWWTDYYKPLRDRIGSLRANGAVSPDLAEVLDATEQEIDLLTRHGDSYGYVFYLLRKNRNRPEPRLVEPGR